MLLAATILPSWVQAASITVDGTTCILADAITAANTDTAAGGCPAGSGADTITLQTDVTLAAALPKITSTITIEGGGNFISGNKNSAGGTVLTVVGNGNLTLNQANVKDGTVGRNGGGIYNTGTLTLANSTVSGNTAFAAEAFRCGSVGGGIVNYNL